MPKIQRYNGNLKAFASEQLTNERTLFGETVQADDLTSQITPEFLRGWGIIGPSDQPSLQDFNAMGYTLGQLLAYLHQMGVAEYNGAQEYNSGSVTQAGGVLYISQSDANIGNAPATSPTFWKAIVMPSQATESVAGVAALASSAEAVAGVNDTKAMTPLKTKQAIAAVTPPQATESVSGIAKVATAVQVAALTNDQTIVTPLKLAPIYARVAVLETAQVFTKVFTTAEQTITPAGSLNITHTLGVAPITWDAFIVCRDAELGYAVGDVLKVEASAPENAYALGVSILVDASAFRCRYGSQAAVFFVLNFTNGNQNVITPSKWRFFIKAYA